MLVAGVLVTGCGAAVADPQTAAPSSRTPVTVPSIVEDTASATTGSSATASSGAGLGVGLRPCVVTPLVGHHHVRGRDPQGQGHLDADGR